jgi:hypothetical protein
LQDMQGVLIAIGARKNNYAEFHAAKIQHARIGLLHLHRQSNSRAAYTVFNSHVKM